MVEKAVKDDICGEAAALRADVQLHEYEALLFGDPVAFANGINRPDLAQSFQKIRDMFDSPEDINDDPIAAPSKRVLGVCPSYRKVIEGTQAAVAVGIPGIREQCRHFREWIQALEALGAAGDVR